MASRGRPPGGKKYGGRVAGTPNKFSGDLKAMILAALEAAGDVEYLLQQTSKNPVAFLSLLGKLLPTQLTGKDGGAIAFDPRHVSDAEVSAQIERLRRLALVDGTSEAEGEPE